MAQPPRSWANVKTSACVASLQRGHNRMKTQENVAGIAGDALIFHARKALSPRESREVPPLDCALVQRLKVAHPNLDIVLKGRD